MVAIEGDLVEPDLGISSENRDLLIKNVNIVFHVAATVRFDEPLKFVDLSHFLVCYLNMFYFIYIKGGC